MSMKIRTLIGSVAVAAALASCGISADGRLALYTPTVTTEYQINGTNTYVGCDNLVTLGANAPANTQVKVSFTTSGTISSAQVRLVGNTTDTQDNSFKKTFTPGDGSLETNGTNSYKVYFTAVSATGDLLPTSKDSISSQAIIVTPIRSTIKNVTVGSRAGNENAGFAAELTGYSDGGSLAVAPFSSLIPVYSQCTLVSDTGVKL